MRPLLTERYRLLDELGRGSIGVVYRARDLILERDVALKQLRPELMKRTRHKRRFLREAQICARLSHPAIVPILDVGEVAREDGEPLPALVMGLLSGVSMRTHLRRGGQPLKRVLSWLSRVCEGVAYAHERGIIHRDIKPAHIFIGDHGEITLTDWGLAKIKPAPGEGAGLTQIGDIVGTPAYMAPEQADGLIDVVDERVDIYALGVILYEILTGTRPYEAQGTLDVLRDIRQGPPPRPSQRAPQRQIPPELEAICLEAMAYDPRQRFESALDISVNIEAFLERAAPGPVPAPPALEVDTGYGEINPEEAAAALTSARAEGAAFLRQLSAAERLEADVARMEAAFNGDEVTARLEEIRARETRARDCMEQAGWHLTQAVEQLHRAGGLSAARAEAHAALAALHRDAWRACAARGWLLPGFFHRARAEHFDDGQLTAELAGRATLSLESEPSGAVVEISKIEDRLGVWTQGPPIRVGTTPLSGRTFSASRVLLRLRMPDGLSARLPLKLSPGETRALSIRCPRSLSVPPGFLYIAGGSFILGADPEAPGAPIPRMIDLAPYCISRDPVSFSAYFEFLEDLIAVGADATPHLPRLSGAPQVEIIDQLVRWRPGVNVELGAPIWGVSLNDALAYARWLSRRLGLALRLPTEAEWAYAAGAVDERLYPWGARFMNGLAYTLRPGQAGPRAVHAFPLDEGPFGMRGAAGGVRAWTSSPADAEGAFMVCGGSWRGEYERCRVGARGVAEAADTADDLGIRLVADLPPDEVGFISRSSASSRSSLA
ncbi:protein kinase [Myxococcota bacterium]|nr:protein kinase [Myxococcota bacterium]